jgi:hypothetical protein
MTAKPEIERGGRGEAKRSGELSLPAPFVTYMRVKKYVFTIASHRSREPILIYNISDLFAQLSMLAAFASSSP